jgi:hypothetical protein
MQEQTRRFSVYLAHARRREERSEKEEGGLLGLRDMSQSTRSIEATLPLEM